MADPMVCMNLANYGEPKLSLPKTVIHRSVYQQALTVDDGLLVALAFYHVLAYF